MRAPELLQQAELLKPGVIDKSGDVQWEIRLELQRLLENALLADVDYSISRHVEQTLWNFCFKNCIDAYQAKLHRRKKDDEVATLQLFLDSCIGHFEFLLGRLCSEYDLRLDFYKSDSILGILDGHFEMKKKAEVASLNYVAQFCLIHSGDIARYQKNFKEAGDFYIHAWRVCPENGHALNQLAILETARGRHLSALALYTRALYVRNPFVFAAGNIEKFYDSIDATKNPSESSYLSSVFQFLSDVHHCRRSNASEELAKNFYDKTVEAYRSGDIDSSDFQGILIVIIGQIWKITSGGEDSSNVYALAFDHRTKVEGTGDSTLLTMDEFWCLRTLFYSLVSLDTAAMELYLAKPDDSTIKDILITIKTASDFLAIHPEILSKQLKIAEAQESAGRFLKTLADFLTRLQAVDAFGDKKCSELKQESPLPEDRQLHGYLPLDKLHAALNFDEKRRKKLDEKAYSKSRINRLISFGQLLAQHLNDPDLFSASTTLDDDKTGEKIWTFAATVDKEKLSNLVPATTPHGAAVVSKPAVTKRQTKVVPLITILEREKIPQENVPEQSVVQESTKLAKNVRFQSPESTKPEPTPPAPAAGTVSSDSTKAKPDELATRFQAARLKQALAGEGKQQQAVSGYHPPWSGQQLPFGAWPLSTVRPNQQSITSPSIAVDRPETPFSRTPGVRPPGPPPFPRPPAFTSPPPGFPMLPPSWPRAPPLGSAWVPQQNMSPQRIGSDAWGATDWAWSSGQQRRDLPFGPLSNYGSENQVGPNSASMPGPFATPPVTSSSQLGHYQQPSAQFSLFGIDSPWEYASDRLFNDGGKD